MSKNKNKRGKRGPMNKHGKRGLILVLIVALAVGCALPAGGFSGRTSYAAEDYRRHAVTYQGERNWYAFSGDFSQGELLDMYYSQRFNLWQGQEEENRIYNADLIQRPTANFDAIRCYVLSKEAKLSVTGKISVFTDERTGSEVSVRIVLARGGSLDNTVDLLAAVMLREGDDDIDLGAQAGLKNVSVDVGDALFFVAAAADPDSVCGAVFAADVTFADVVSSAAPASRPASSPMRMDEGDLTFRYDDAGNALSDPKGIVTAGMSVDNRTGNQRYVFQEQGVQKFSTMDFAGYEAPGSWYTMPNSSSSVGAVWFNKWLSNPGQGYGNAGLLYTAPMDGTLSVLGAYARSSAVEKGDDGASPDESAHFRLIRLRGDNWQVLVPATPIDQGTVGYFADIEGMQNLSVQAGDQICLQYLSTSAWKFSCMSILYDYLADPTDVNTGWAVSGDIPKETYDSTYGDRQGANSWYYAYGKSDGEYYSMNYADGAFGGKDVYSEVSIDRRVMRPSNSSAVMKVYKAVGEGSARVVGNLQALTMDANGLTFRVSKRAYAGNGWGPAEVLYTVDLGAKKTFAEWNLTELPVGNGDLFFFEVLSKNTAANRECGVSAELNAYVDFSVPNELAEVGEGIGARESAFNSEWYSGTQGKNGWFYAYGSKDNYVLMKYGFGNLDADCWFGPEWNTAIESTSQSLGAYTGVMRIYVADRAGTLIVAGNASVLSTDGEEGVKAQIFHNGAAVWSEQYQKDDRAPRDVNLTLTVKKGDVVMFHAENNAGNTVAYATKFFYKVAVALNSDSTDVAAEETLVNYLRPKGSYAEFLGIPAGPQVPPEGRIEGESSSGCAAGVSLEAGVLAALLLGGALILGKRKEEKQ